MSPVKVRAADIETMHMAWHNSQQEQDAVKHGVVAGARQHHDRERREEDVDAC